MNNKPKQENTTTKIPNDVRCYCLNPAVVELVSGWGLCEGHYERWRYRQPIIYVDNIGVGMLEHLKEVAVHAVSVSASWIEPVFYFPCVFSGTGTYTDRQNETLSQIQADYEAAYLDVRRSGGKPKIVFNSPFFNLMALPYHDKILTTRHALRYLLRPAVWLFYYTEGSDYELASQMKHILSQAADMTPTTWIYISQKPVTNRRNAWHIWNTAMNLWNRQYERYKKGGKQQ